MAYNSYLKEKITNLYSVSQKIGKHSIINEDFVFLDKYFSNEIKTNVYAVSEVLYNIIEHYKSDLLLQNKIGIDFLNALIRSRETANIFIQQTSLHQPQINSSHKQELEEKYTKLAAKYGLNEFYYTLNPKLTPEENYNKAILLLNKTETELKTLQQKLGIKESFNIGNNILNIQVNWHEKPEDQGYYNYCSNTLCLKDENSTFPLIHEYVHFIDKTTACLLLTGKTSQQLFEEKVFTQKELFNNFDMSVFSQVEFNKENFPWITTLKLKYLFSEEINQNKYMKNVFNKFEHTKDYQQEFKDIMYDWIEEKQYANKNLLKQEIDNLLKNKATKVENINQAYSQDEIEIVAKTLIFNTFDLNMNNSKNWSEELDTRIGKIYYSTPKEMLARTMEQATQGKLQQLSERLTTPILSKDEKKKFFEIIKVWQTASQEIMDYQNKQNTSNRIAKLRNKLEANPNVLYQFKLNS